MHSELKEAGPPAAAPKRALWRRLWPLAIIVAAMIAFYLSGATDYVSLNTIIREREALAAAVDGNLLPAILIYEAVYIVAVACSFPGAALLTIVGGFLFGPIGGTVLTIIAATIGASIIFLVARTSVGEVLRARAGRFGSRLAKGFEDNAFSYLFLLRLVPVFPFWLINVAPALFNVPLRTFVGATALGIIPGTLAYNLLGSGLGDLIVSLEEANPGCAQAGTCELTVNALLTPGPLIAMAALMVAALIPLAVKRWRGTRGKVPA